MNAEAHAYLRTATAAIAAVALVVIAWASYWIAEAEQEQACWASSIFQATVMNAAANAHQAQELQQAEKRQRGVLKWFSSWSSATPDSVNAWAAIEGLNENCTWRGLRTISGNGGQP